VWSAPYFRVTPRSFAAGGVGGREGALFYPRKRKIFVLIFVFGVGVKLYFCNYEHTRT
jgi:hypothetical protein